MKAKVSIVKCESYDQELVFAKVREAIDLLGGITGFIKPGSRVLLKPNLLLAVEPERGVDTHPAVVRSLVRILKGINCRVYLGDGPSIWGKQCENIDRVYNISGMRSIAEEEGAELVKFDRRRWRNGFSLTSWVDDCDYLVSLPKFKTHNMMLLTGAVKNLFGLVSNTDKTELHKKFFKKEDFARMLVDIYKEVKPALTIIDGIVAMEGSGPGTSGKLRNQGILLAGADCVALDSILALIMGLKPLDILTTKDACERNLGAADASSIEILGNSLNDATGSPFQLPGTSLGDKIPRPFINVAKKLIKFYPEIDAVKCVSCGACIQVCPAKVMSMKKKRIVVDYSGCISCFCCQESCPSSAIEVKKSLFAKIVGL